MKLIARKDIAFGQGTRPKGFVFGDVQTEGKWIAVHRESLTTKPENLKSAAVELSDGVTSAEFRQAILNVGITTELSTDDGEKQPVIVNWQDVAIADTDFSKSVKEKLSGLKTLGDLEAYTQDHQGFSGLELTTNQEQAVLKRLAEYVQQ